MSNTKKVRIQSVPPGFKTLPGYRGVIPKDKRKELVKGNTVELSTMQLGYLVKGSYVEKPDVTPTENKRVLSSNNSQNEETPQTPTEKDSEDEPEPSDGRRRRKKKK